MANWYYVQNGAQAGPVTEDQIKQMLQAGSLSSTSQLWTEGQADWVALSQLPQFSSPVAASPPPALGAAPPSSQAPLATQNPVYQAPQHAGQMGSFAQKPANYLWQSILATLLCCLPAGVVAIVYAAKVDSLWNAGNHTEALEASKKAKLWVNISAGFVLVIFAFYFIAALLGAA